MYGQKALVVVVGVGWGGGRGLLLGYKNMCVYGHNLLLLRWWGGAMLDYKNMIYLGSITAALRKFTATKHASNNQDKGETSPNSAINFMKRRLT